MFIGTVSKEIEAVSPEVSMATTSGSGLGTGITCRDCTYNFPLKTQLNNFWVQETFNFLLQKGKM